PRPKRQSQHNKSSGAAAAKERPGRKGRAKVCKGAVMASRFSPDVQIAVDFLRALGSPRTLVEIEPDTGKITADTPNTSEKVRAWVKRNAAASGIYFTVNRTKRPMTKKPEK